MEEKKQLRQDAMARREGIDEATRQAAAQSFAQAASRLSELVPGPVVSAFRPFGAEVDCMPLLSELVVLGHVTALPVVVARGRPLEFRRWKPGDALVSGHWNIPVPREEAGTVEPDGLIVPLLAFDRNGYRLGYGGGFYDRTLANLRAKKPIVAIGLAFAAQEVDSVPHAAYDARLDWVLSEAELIKVGDGSAHSVHR